MTAVIDAVLFLLQNLYWSLCQRRCRSAALPHREIHWHHCAHYKPHRQYR